MLGNLRRAWRLYQTDSRADTIGAVVLVAVALYPFVRAYWAVRKGGGRTSSEG